MVSSFATPDAAQAAAPYAGARRFSVAPMMDWTDRHCRAFHRTLTHRALLYTEMVTAQAVLRGDRDHLLGFDGVEHPVALQLGGSDPDLLAQRAEQLGLSVRFKLVGRQGPEPHVAGTMQVVPHRLTAQVVPGHDVSGLTAGLDEFLKAYEAVRATPLASPPAASRTPRRPCRWPPLWAASSPSPPPTPPLLTRQQQMTRTRRCRRAGSCRRPSAWPWRSCAWRGGRWPTAAAAAHQAG
jgi:hypothetical protein